MSADLANAPWTTEENLALLVFYVRLERNPNYPKDPEATERNS